MQANNRSCTWESLISIVVMEWCIVKRQSEKRLDEIVKG